MNRPSCRAAGAAFALCLTSAAAHAASPTAPVGEPREVIVTATRIQQPLDQTIASTTVITREDIQRRQARSVHDLLAGEIGIDMVNSGGYGKLSTLHVRGTEPDHVLVLVDGVRLGSATAGTTRLEFIPIEQIERIEIVRGPRSSLYGPNALGGVIQIFTTRDRAPQFTVGAGSHDTYNATASIGHRGEQAWFNVGVNRFQTRGYDSCRAAQNAGCRTDEPDDDGFRSTSGTLRAGYAWDDRADIEGSVLYATGLTEYDGAFGNETEFTQQITAVRARLRPRADWTLTAAVGIAEDKADDLLNGDFQSSFDTRKYDVSLQSDWAFAPQQLLTLGLDYIEDRVDSTTVYDERSRDNTGIFAQYQGRFGAHGLQAVVRSDDNEQFGSYTTGTLGWKWNLGRSLALHAAWGTAFMAPNFNDLYFPGFGNPDLEPEESQSWELGLAGGEALRWSIAAFQIDSENLIVFDAATWLPANLSETRIRGIEADLRTQLGPWSLGLGYTGLDPRNLASGPDHDNILPRRARHAARLDVGYTWERAWLGATVNASGSRYEELANQTRLGGYVVLDLVAEVTLNREWALQARLGNALDREYETIDHYRQDGRNVFVSLRWRPGG